jgi:hypothetical protein
MIFNAKVKNPPILSSAEVIQTMEITVEQGRYIISELQKRIDYVDAGISIVFYYTGATGHSISGAVDRSKFFSSVMYFLIATNFSRSASVMISSINRGPE